MRKNEVKPMSRLELLESIKEQFDLYGHNTRTFETLTYIGFDSNDDFSKVRNVLNEFYEKEKLEVKAITELQEGIKKLSEHKAKSKQALEKAYLGITDRVVLDKHENEICQSILENFRPHISNLFEKYCVLTRGSAEKSQNVTQKEFAYYVFNYLMTANGFYYLDGTQEHLLNTWIQHCIPQFSVDKDDISAIKDAVENKDNTVIETFVYSPCKRVQETCFTQEKPSAKELIDKICDISKSSFTQEERESITQAIESLVAKGHLDIRSPDITNEKDEMNNEHSSIIDYQKGTDPLFAENRSNSSDDVIIEYAKGEDPLESGYAQGNSFTESPNIADTHDVMDFNNENR